MEPLTIVKEIISFAFSHEQEKKKARLLNEIGSDVSAILGLIENVGQVVGRLIVANELNTQSAAIVSAIDEFGENDFENAHDRARDAANRLMQLDLRLDGCANFLLAAGADITALDRLSKLDPAWESRLRDFALRYALHAEAMVPVVHAEAAKRVTISESSFAVPLLIYQVDGKTIGSKRKTGPNLRYYQQKSEGDATAMASRLVHPLKTAAETWRSIAERRKPQYGPIFEGCYIGGSDPPTPGALINEGRRIHFEVEATLKNFTNITSVVSNEVFDNVPLVAEVMGGARCVDALGRPGGFVTRQSTLVLVDSPKPVTDNRSFVERITGEDWAKFKVVAELHVYQFFGN